ncbi:MAG: glycosyltransferase [Planctomycetota bacterium]
MKILYLAPHAFYVDRGTPISVDLNLRAISDRGRDEVHVCVYGRGEDRAYPNVTVHRADVPRWVGEIGPGFSAKKLLADVSLFRLAGQVFRRERPDLVYAGEEAVFLATRLRRRFGVPYVYDMDSSLAQQLVEKKRWLRPLAGCFAWCEGRAIRGAAACVPVCPALADVARSRGAEHVELLPDISDLADPDRPATGFLRERLGLPPGRPILMYVGNLEAYQGVDLLLGGYELALRQQADLELVIVGGSDADLAAYRRKVERRGLAGRAHLLGRWPAARLDEVLAEADILASPRVRGINTPQKIFPYLHSGRPVLMTDLLTHNQVVDNSVCRLAAPTPAAFASAMKELADDAGLRARLGAAGRAFVEAGHVYAAHRRRVDRLLDGVAARHACGAADTAHT